MAKKKKATNNPARGYATTSVASKTRAEAEPENRGQSSISVPHDTLKKTLDTDSAASVSSEQNASEPSVSVQQELTPEQLEQQLERDELQLLVERHAAKIRRDASRQVSRAQTEARILRGQAQSLALSSWLSKDALQQILNMAAEDAAHDPQNASDGQYRSQSEDDLALQLWALEQALSGLGTPSGQVKLALKQVLEKPPEDEDSTYIWGLQESLEFLAMRDDQSALPEFDQKRPPPVANFNEVDAGRCSLAWPGATLDFLGCLFIC